MREWAVSDEEIERTEKLLLPTGCHFNEDARIVIREWKSSEVAACPGSGKTTVLLAKLKILADRMPLEQGSGVCVLSHTNVAVDEIRSRMPSYAGRLLGYPNFMGTIQSFVDRFLAVPFLRWRHGIVVRPIERELYGQAFLNAMRLEECRELKNYVRMRSRQSHGGQSEASIVGEARLSSDGSLIIGSTTIAATTPTATQFARVYRTLMERDGLIRYEESYTYALQALDEMPGDYVGFLRERFSYVFVDEYQDCSQVQKEILRRVFGNGNCSYMRIGDPDQAIYSSYRKSDIDWHVDDAAITINGSNRYGQAIANILTPLRAHGPGINSTTGAGARPTLIVYDQDSITKVPDTFAKQIVDHGIYKPDGVYKAIGFIRSETTKGTKIGSYWHDFDASRPRQGGEVYWDMLEELRKALCEGELHRAMPTFKRLISRILRYAKITDEDTGKEITAPMVGRLLDDEMRLQIIRLATSPPKETAALDKWLRDFFEKMVRSKKPEEVYQCIPPNFMVRQSNRGVYSHDKNVYVDATHGVRIQFDTVHGVKGETHDATLYLETKYQRSTDICRVLPLYNGGKTSKSPLYEYCRKLVYVGLSRPSKLLCLAISSETYKTGKKAFKDWEVVDLRGR
jgi:hypothetical protein